MSATDQIYMKLNENLKVYMYKKIFKKASLQWKVHLVYPASLQTLHANTQKQIIRIQCNRIKNPNWQEATSWLFTSVAEDLNTGQPRTKHNIIYISTKYSNNDKRARTNVFAMKTVLLTGNLGIAQIAACATIFYKRLDTSSFLICDFKVSQLRLLASLSFLDKLCNSLGPRYLKECLP